MISVATRPGERASIPVSVVTVVTVVCRLPGQDVRSHTEHPPPGGDCDCPGLQVNSPSLLSTGTPVFTVQTKTAQLEEAILSLSGEVVQSLTGMRGSLTALLRRMESLERREGRPGRCVATQDSSHLPGMDDWCAENCSRGNCPPHLCSCPVQG